MRYAMIDYQPLRTLVDRRHGSIALTKWTGLLGNSRYVIPTTLNFVSFFDQNWLNYLFKCMYVQ